jgi:tetratricopeptide (TPR) repeat protein
MGDPSGKISGDISANSSAPNPSNHRLDSWKEIAAFFGRDERTVRRWEKERGLPAHRVPGKGRGGVFAYSGELKEWLSGRADDLEAVEFEAITTADAVEIDPGISEVEKTESRLITNAPSPGLPPKLATYPQVNLAEVEIPTAVDLRPHSAVSQPVVSRPLVHQQSVARIVAWLAPLLAAAILIMLFSFTRSELRFKNAFASAHVPNAEAQELYLKGEYHWAKRTPEDLNKAVDYFTQSIVKDPAYAQAYVGLADCYNLLREFSVMPPEEAYPRALAAAQKAVELDDTSAGAHTSVAFATFYWNWDPVTAEREYKRALELDANFVQAHHWYATFLLASGRYREALDQIEQARKLDPSSTTIQADKGYILFNAGRKTEAFSLLKQLESTDPTLASTHRYLAAIYFDRKDYDDFFAESKQAAELRHDQSALAVTEAAQKGFATGSLDGMRQSMLPLQKERFDRSLGSAYELAATYAALGNKEDALRYLQAAYEKHDEGLLYLSRNPDFNILHDDLVYKEITERVAERTSRPRS